MITKARTNSLLDTGIRIAADAIMVNAAFAIALLARGLVEILGEKGGPPRAILFEYVQVYLQAFWLLTIISLTVFYISGFYSRGRYYQSWYKALVVAQAVSLSYLIFGCAAFLTQDVSGLPRSVLFAGWLFTSGLLIAARLWNMLWRTLNVPETFKPRLEIAKRGSRRVLVIGGAGYIGSALLPKLLERGYHVRLLDLFLFGKEPIVNVIGHRNLDIIQADFRHMDKIVHAMRDMDDVIHLGGIVGDPACSLDQELTVEVNLMATRMIAEVAKGSGIGRLCFASTCSVYGASDEILDERSGLNPISLYAQSKLASEKVLTQLADDHFAPVILRFGTVYGLSGRTRFDLIVNLLTAKAVIERKITVFGGGQWRPFLHVDDAALALMKAIEAPRDLVSGQIFNVGSNEQNYQLGEAGRLIQAMVPNAELVDMGADTDYRNYRVDFLKIKRMLGFTPLWSLEDGIRQVIVALENGDVRDYRHPMYSNVKFLSEESNSRLIRRENGWAQELIKQEIVSGRRSVVAAAS